jgi:hypothetical protein
MGAGIPASSLEDRTGLLRGSASSLMLQAPISHLTNFAELALGVPSYILGLAQRV